MSNNIKVDDKLIADLSKLAKLKFDKQSAEKMKSDLSTILGFVAAISKVDTEGVEPLIYMSDEVMYCALMKLEMKCRNKTPLKMHLKKIQITLKCLLF